MNWRRILSLRAAESFFRHQATAQGVLRGRLPWPLGALLVLIVVLTNPWALLLANCESSLGLGVYLLAILWGFLSLLVVGFAAERITRHLPYVCSIAHWISYRLDKRGFTAAVSIASGIFQTLLLIVLVTHAAQLIGGSFDFLDFLIGSLVLASGVALLWSFRKPLRILAYAAGLFVLRLVPLALDEHTLASVPRLWDAFAPIFDSGLLTYQKWLVGFLIAFGTPCSLAFDSRLLLVATSVRRGRLGYCFVLAGGIFLLAAAVLLPRLDSPPLDLRWALVVLLTAAIAFSLLALAATWATLTFGFDDAFKVLDRIVRGEDDTQPEVANVLSNAGRKALATTWVGALLAFAVFFVFTLLSLGDFANRILLSTAAVIALAFGPPFYLSLWRRASIKSWISSLVLCLIALVLLVFGFLAHEKYEYLFFVAGLPLFVLAWVVVPPYVLQTKWNPPLPEVEGPD